MANKSIRVSLREQKNKSGRNSLFLDFYPPIYDEKKKKETRRKFIDLYVFEKPANKAEKEHNKFTIAYFSKTDPLVSDQTDHLTGCRAW